MIKSKSNATIKSVQRQFKYWRAHRKIRRPIPQKLWDRAIKLTEKYPINHVSKALRLDYVKLRERVTAPVYKKTNFIELDLGNKIAGGEEVEIEDNLGWKLRIRGKNLKELMETAKEIWRERI